ncbi:MAG: hypothetical protein AAFY15_11005 [Cyanobacteria bacterium J06648_11]
MPYSQTQILTACVYLHNKESYMIAIAAVPSTPGWSLSVGLTMILCNITAILLWKSVVPLINAWLGAIGYENRTGFTVPAEAAGIELPLLGTLPEI